MAKQPLQINSLRNASDAVNVAHGAWQKVSSVPSILDGELHVWWIKIYPDTGDNFRDYLSDEEIQRAQRFRDLRHRSAFVVSRGSLRILLGSYLCIPPTRVKITYSQDGKPTLNELGNALPRFNLSHSGENLLIAISSQADVGVDIERHDGALDNGTVLRSLHPDELRIFDYLKKEERLKFFFDCWTRKEAFLKMLGCGFAFEPNELNLSAAGCSGLAPQGTDAFFTNIPPIIGYSTAVATTLPPLSTSFYTSGSGVLA